MLHLEQKFGGYETGLWKRLGQKTLYSEVINASDAQIKKRVNDPMIVSIYSRRKARAQHISHSKG